MIDGAEATLSALLDLMARLRSPDGCPWDREQNFASIVPYTIEEAYEVADAIARGDVTDLRDELGDLLFQVVFHAQMAKEAGDFDFADVARGVVAKITRRHPHVFGDADLRTASEQTVAWEAIKADERAAKSKSSAGILSDVPVGLPALTRAVKLSKRAARVGFVWAQIGEVIAKLQEEVAELEAEIAAGDQAKMTDELGDVLFVCANIARHLDIDPEAALRGANAKFTRRFEFIERSLAADGRTPVAADLAEMEALWQAAKANEKQAGGMSALPGSRRSAPAVPGRRFGL